MIESGMPDFDTAIGFRLMAPFVATFHARHRQSSRAARQAVKSNDVVAAWLPRQAVDPLEGGPDDSPTLITSELNSGGRDRRNRRSAEAIARRITPP